MYETQHVATIEVCNIITKKNAAVGTCKKLISHVGFGKFRK
jgi:hypothetical protein